MIKKIISIFLALAFSVSSVSQAMQPLRATEVGALLNERFIRMPLNTSLQDARQILLEGLSNEEIDGYLNGQSRSDLAAADWSLQQLKNSGQDRALTLQDAMVASIANKQYADGGASLFLIAIVIFIAYKLADAP